MTKFKFIAAFSLLAVLIVLPACSRKEEVVKARDTADTVAVKAMAARAEQVARRVALVGTLEGAQEVTVSSEVAARVLHVRADLGDRVQQGQVLIELDSTNYRMAVDRQQAALSEAMARLGMT